MGLTDEEARAMEAEIPGGMREMNAQMISRQGRLIGYKQKHERSSRA